MGSLETEKVGLLPWDPSSTDHVDRMFQQRVACGWKSEDVDDWRVKQQEGSKALYWIVLSEAVVNKDDLVGLHLDRYPDEKGKLKDTASSVRATPREPTGEEFLPIGHIGLESRPDVDKKVGLGDEGVYWITSLYISWPMHNSGLGRSAMRQTERLATEHPLNCRVMVLDTVSKEWQLHEDAIKAMYPDRGIPMPRILKSSEEWYQRQGYEIFKRDVRGYDWHAPSGVVFQLPIIYLKKRLA